MVCIPLAALYPQKNAWLHPKTSHPFLKLQWLPERVPSFRTKYDGPKNN